MHCSHIYYLKGGATNAEKVKCDTNAEKVTYERAFTYVGLSVALPKNFSHPKNLLHPVT